MNRLIRRISSSGHRLFEIRIVLLLISIAYLLAYFAHPSTPGNRPGQNLMDWWGWFDQGQYLLSANSMAVKNFTPENHFYPPLYPALGALFSKWSSGHMYFIIDLAALLWFAFVFIRFSDRYLPRWASVLLFFGTSILDVKMFQNYIIPWTTTLGTAFLATGIIGLVWLIEVREGRRSKLTGLQVFIAAAGLSLLVPTRPADAAAGIILGLGFLLCYWITWKDNPAKVPGPVKFSSLIFTGVSIGPLIFFGFNSLVFGSFMGQYIKAASSNGFFPADLPEKFVSLWLDGFTLYGVSSSCLTERYPWLLISLAGLLWVFIRGDILLRLVGIAICVLFTIYMPYGDLLPNGLWNYLNIHYFKWTFPFLALIGTLLIIHTWQAWRLKQNRVMPTVILLGIPLLLLSLHLTVHTTPATPKTVNTSNGISFDLEDKYIDFLDLKGINGEFHHVYFGDHHLTLDGQALRYIRDYHVLPIDQGIRVLFIRPVQGKTLVFLPDPRLSSENSLAPQIGTYGFSLGNLNYY